MKYCPILSFQTDRYCEIGCREDRCAFADEAGDCLVRQALQCYVNAHHSRIADKTAAMKTVIEIEKGDPLPRDVPHGTVVLEKY